MSAAFVLPLDSPLATLVLSGGKGANLSRLIRAGFAVPGGFIITTAGYDAFLEANDLGAALAGILSRAEPSDPQSLDAASAAIRQLFRRAAMPGELANEICDAYEAKFGAGGCVAVRSSATAEDLPDLSFAGQQDTYLNVSGVDALLAAVVDCWGSLWTGRAIGYRARNGISHKDISLAVVTQAMAPAEAAGVLFTANPLTGLRSETVIDATLGLGEALVAGQVEPDHYVVDVTGNAIIEKRLGSKGAEENRSRQALPDAAILDLAALAARVQASFGAPQDIEWTWGEGRLALVQARPITSLYPLPDDLPADDLRVLGSFGAFQGVVGPFTPLGQDALRHLFAQMGRSFGYPHTHETQGVLRIAGERLWVDLTGALRNRIGRRLAVGALGQVEPGIRAAMLPLLDDPRLAPRSSGFNPDMMRRLAPAFLTLAPRFVRTLIVPDKSRAEAEAGVEAKLAEFATAAAAARTLADRLALLDAITASVRDFMFRLLLPRFAPGMASLYHLYALTRDLPGGRQRALEVTRGLPHNVTTEMDLALWQTAQRIQADDAAARTLAERAGGALAADYLAGRLPPAAQEAIGQFMARYGARGPGEIDLGRPRWREDPTPVLEAIKSYAGITDPQRAPDAVFARSAASAEAAIPRLASDLRALPHGRIRAARARWAARRVRALAGLRETPKFTIVRALGLVRQTLLESGQDLVRAGFIEAPEDIFFLRLTELRRLAAIDLQSADAPTKSEIQARVVERRRNDAREARRRQTPRVLLSDGRAFYGEAAAGAADESAESLTGSPVSPGVVEGRVNVVFHPASARIEPGDVLVCPGTDPSWTPLFLVAAALITEVGGLMTHGSVVAREYGIPAVVGVAGATARLRTGQRIRVDGSAGIVTVLTGSEA